MRTHPKYAHAFRWGVLLSVTGSAQILIQALGLLSGFLIIHMVSPAEYALYTLAYTVLGAIVALADGGVGGGVMAYAGRSWEDKYAMGRVVATGMALRKVLAAVTLAVALPTLFVLLIKHGAGWIMALLIVLALVPAFLSSLTDDLLSVPIKLNQDIVPLQKNDILANVGRILMLAAGLFVLPFTAVAILANGLPRIWANFKLRKISQKFADFSAPPDPEAREEILKIVKRTLPGTIYYCISAPVAVWLISIYGNTTAIAEIGALSRLTSVLAVFGAVFGTLIQPRFARLPPDAGNLLRKFLLLFGGATFLYAAILVFVYFFPTQVLFVLGKNYSNLTTEVVLSAAAGCLTTLIGLVYALSISRGWVLPPSINISLSIVVQIVLMLSFDLSSTTSVLWLTIGNAAFGVLMYSSYFLYRIYKLRTSPAPA
ncbi:Membrane protein involved in the export of O-antigen and teichoic acid [Burkholderiales bacterium 8X]|nr:Membrane protein involved in the export of O-antigen and teichoic acid [Burkholderiales bacterium 8X]